MVAFYRVNNLSWWMGKALVRVPFYSMVNLVAERRIVPELIQDRNDGRRTWRVKLWRCWKTKPLEKLCGAIWRR